MSNNDFQHFRVMVLRDLALQRELAPIEDRREFIERVVELGRVNSFEFEKEDVVRAMRDARNSWVERWK